MGKKVKVASIEIRYPDGSAKQVSIEDARELYTQLKELFGEKVVNVPATPVIIERERWPRWTPDVRDNTTMVPEPMPKRPQIWCSAANSD